MLDIKTAFIVYMTEMLISYTFFLNTALRKRNAVMTLIAGTVIFSAGALLNVACGNNIFINLSAFTLIDVIFAILCFQIDMRKALLYSVVLTMLSGLTEYIVIFSVSAFSGISADAYNDDFSILMLECPISKILYFLFAMVLARAISCESRSSRIPFTIFVYPIISLCCLYIFWYIGAAKKIDVEAKYLLVFAGFGLMLSTLILFIKWQHYAAQEEELSKARGQLYHDEMEKVYYGVLERQNQKLMMYAHDAKKHLNAMKNINDNIRLDKYIDDLADDLDDYTHGCHSGNKMLDIILSKYMTEAVIHDVKFEYDISECRLNNVEDHDLVTILGNLFDNAIMSASAKPDGYIGLETLIKNGYSVITIKNSCYTPIVVKNGKLLTTKEEKAIHGMGMLSVMNTLKKYSGDMDWEYDQGKNEFIVTAILKETDGKN